MSDDNPITQLALTDETGATLPSPAQIRAYYRARARADDAIGQILSATLRKSDVSPSLRNTLEVWFHFHPECRY